MPAQRKPRMSVPILKKMVIYIHDKIFAIRSHIHWSLWGWSVDSSNDFIKMSADVWFEFGQGGVGERRPKDPTEFVVVLTISTSQNTILEKGQRWRKQVLTSRGSCELKNVNIHVSFNCFWVKSVNIVQCLDICEGEMIRLDSYDIAWIKVSNTLNWRAYHIWCGDHTHDGQGLPWWHEKHKWDHSASTTIHLDSDEVEVHCIALWEL